MLFYISMNLGTFACIVSFGLRTGTDNIRDYAGLYTKDPYFTLLFSLSSLSQSRTKPLFCPFSASHQLEARAPRGEVVVLHASPTPTRTKT